MNNLEKAINISYCYMDIMRHIIQKSHQKIFEIGENVSQLK